MNVAALIDELFFSSKFRETARSLQADPSVFKSADSVPANVSRVFVDLSATTFDPIAEIAKLKAASPSRPVTAFFSHVQIDMKERAIKAGADEVVPRSAFAQRLTDVIRGV